MVTFVCGHHQTPANSIRVGWLASREPKLACRRCHLVRTAASARDAYARRNAPPTAWVVKACST